MRITPVEYRLMLPRDDNRSLGLHVSNIVRDIALESGILKAEWANQDINDAPERIAMGLAWEDWIFPRHPDVCYHPGELSKSNIAMSVDGISFLGEKDVRVHECKLTWKSMGRDLRDEWMWIAQTKTYCHGWGTNKAVWHIFWVNGDYKRGSPSGGPQYRIYDIEFTPMELRDNWQAILNHAPNVRRKLGI